MLSQMPLSLPLPELGSDEEEDEDEDEDEEDEENDDCDVDPDLDIILATAARAAPSPPGRPHLHSRALWLMSIKDMKAVLDHLHVSSSSQVALSAWTGHAAILAGGVQEDEPMPRSLSPSLSLSLSASLPLISPCIWWQAARQTVVVVDVDVLPLVLPLLGFTSLPEACSNITVLLMTIGFLLPASASLSLISLPEVPFLTIIPGWSHGLPGSPSLPLILSPSLSDPLVLSSPSLPLLNLLLLLLRPIGLWLPPSSFSLGSSATIFIVFFRPPCSLPQRSAAKSTASLPSAALFVFLLRTDEYGKFTSIHFSLSLSLPLLNPPGPVPTMCTLWTSLAPTCSLIGLAG